MPITTIEFYEDVVGTDTKSAPYIFGMLISSIEDTTLSTVVEHFAIPANAGYYAISTDTGSYFESGTGNQDCGSTRRMVLFSNTKEVHAVNPLENTVSYRTIA